MEEFLVSMTQLFVVSVIARKATNVAEKWVESRRPKTIDEQLDDIFTESKKKMDLASERVKQQ
jgi:hypothetical protein